MTKNEPTKIVNIRMTDRQIAAYEQAIPDGWTRSDHLRHLIKVLVTTRGVPWPFYKYERGVFKINRDARSEE